MTKTRVIAALVMAPIAIAAILLLLADIGVRLAYNDGQELKLGVLTALIGAPFFLSLILGLHRRSA